MVVKSNGCWVDSTIILLVQAGNALALIFVHDTTARGTQKVEGVGQNVAQQVTASFMGRSNQKNVFVPQVDCESFGLVDDELFLNQ